MPIKGEYICTICCKNKSTQKGLIPARKRYISLRIDKILYIAKEQNVPALILSGKYGLINPDRKILCYDFLLTTDHVEKILPKVINQCKRLNIQKLIFYAKSRKEPGWLAYYQVIERVCEILEIKLETVSI